LHIYYSAWEAGGQRTILCDLLGNVASPNLKDDFADGCAARPKFERPLAFAHSRFIALWPSLSVSLGSLWS
jgi:hypothetical protein